MPMALSLIPEVLKSKLENSEKLALILDFDKVFGLGLKTVLGSIYKTGEGFSEDNFIKNEDGELKINAQKYNTEQFFRISVKEREEARKEKNYEKADELRKKIEDMGYIVKDASDGFEIFKKD
jgi:cysteinyl-tRNA synthetase